MYVCMYNKSLKLCPGFLWFQLTIGTGWWKRLSGYTKVDLCRNGTTWCFMRKLIKTRKRSWILQLTLFQIPLNWVNYGQFLFFVWSCIAFQCLHFASNVLLQLTIQVGKKKYFILNDWKRNWYFVMERASRGYSVFCV